jgi:hypothetical protein
MFFLIDENVAEELGGRLFAFSPYDYGPFDSDVYHELTALQRLGLVTIEAAGPSAGRRRYAVTAEGERVGTSQLAELPAGASDYIRRVSQWVRSLSFAQLVGAIYKAYPAMRANSVFRD